MAPASARRNPFAALPAHGFKTQRSYSSVFASTRLMIRQSRRSDVKGEANDVVGLNRRDPAKEEWAVMGVGQGRQPHHSSVFATVQLRSGLKRSIAMAR